MFISSIKNCTGVVRVCFSSLSLMCDKPTVVSGTEGQMFDFICEYPSDRKNNTKHFCCLDIEESFVQVVRTSKHNEWTREGRVSLYDNTTAGYFIVRLDVLYLNDSGQYYCGDFGSGDQGRGDHFFTDCHIILPRHGDSFNKYVKIYMYIYFKKLHTSASMHCYIFQCIKSLPPPWLHQFTVSIGL
uniref:Immunoglobulin V-set domain-containing protein n=1 Tax=Xiphophorus maculatus TaxID=8083 RepID=A0A3B5QWA7_XIPMA